MSGRSRERWLSDQQDLPVNERWLYACKTVSHVTLLVPLPFLSTCYFNNFRYNLQLVVSLILVCFKCLSVIFIMDSNNLSHNPPLSWGYTSGAPSAGTWSNVPSRSVKRPLSESDDCEDVFSEESSKEQ